MNADAEILRDHALFRRLARRALQQLAEHATRIEYRKGSIVARDGDPGDALFVVISGRCEATVQTHAGSRHVTEIYGPGSIFGERALLSRDRFSATVRVLTDCVVLRLPAEDVRAVVERHPELEKDLLARMFGEYRVLRHGAPPAKFGRIAVFYPMSQRVRGGELVTNIATALRMETGRSVLHVDVARGGSGLSFADWRKLPPCTLEELRAVADVHKSGSGVWELRLRAGDDGHEAEFVAPILSHMARYARYLVIHLDPSVPDALAVAMLVQSDLPYLLFNQRNEDVARAQTYCKMIAEHPSRDQSKALPIVCREEGERRLSHRTLGERLGEPVHGTVEALPRSAGGGAREYYRQHPKDRFSAHIRHVAREIGRCRIGLALSSGGAKSLAHIGVIQVLEENGIEVDVVAGTSMGALIAALWAFGLDGKAIEKIALRNERPGALWNLVDPLIPPRRGFIGGVAVTRIVRDAMQDAHFSDMLRRLRIVATDLNTLERVVFDSGEVAPVVHASMAMPGIVAPAELEGRTLVDGGVAEPMPVHVLDEMGIERILAVNTIPNPAEMREFAQKPEVPRGKIAAMFDHYVNYFAQGNILDIWAKSMHGAETRVAEEACKHADVVLRPVSPEGRWHDFGHPSKYIALGRQVALAHLDEIRRLTR